MARRWPGLITLDDLTIFFDPDDRARRAAFDWNPCVVSPAVIDHCQVVLHADQSGRVLGAAATGRAPDFAVFEYVIPELEILAGYPETVTRRMNAE
jgi:hypothetical protein